MLLSLLLSGCLLLNNTDQEYVVVLNDGKKLIGKIVSKDNTGISFKRKGVTQFLKFNKIRSIKKRSRSTPRSKEVPKPVKQKEQDTEHKTETIKKNPEVKDEVVEALVKAAREGREKELEALISQLGGNLTEKLKNYLKEPTEDNAKLVLKLLKKITSYDQAKPLWVWFLGFASGKELYEGVTLLETWEHPIESLEIILTSLEANNKKGGKTLRASMERILKKIKEIEYEGKPKNDKRFVPLKSLLYSRVSVEIEENAEFVFTIISKRLPEFKKKDWESFITHKHLAVRLAAMGVAIDTNYRDYKKNKLNKQYLNSEDLNEKVMILKYMNWVKNVINDPNMKFLNQLYKDAKSKHEDRGVQKMLSVTAYRRLKIDTGEKWPLNSPKWKEYLGILD